MQLCFCQFLEKEFFNRHACSQRLEGLHLAVECNPEYLPYRGLLKSWKQILSLAVYPRAELRQVFRDPEAAYLQLTRWLHSVKQAEKIMAMINEGFRKPPRQ